MTTAEQTLKLGIVARSQYAAITEGIAKLKGVTLECVEVAPMPKLFDRMIDDLEFDISEMAMVTFLQLKELGLPFTGIPIFPMRSFAHTSFTYNVKSGIKTPKDLEDRKAGVRAYAGTKGVWARGIISSEYDVNLSKVTWVISDIEHLHGVPTVPNVLNMSGSKLADLLTSGEIAAGIDVMGVDSPDVMPLLANAGKAHEEWFKRTGIFPINNCMVIRDEVLAAHPGLAEEFFNVYKQAKSLYLQRLKAQGAKAKDQEADLKFAELTGDPLPIGIDANRPALEAIASDAHNQGVIANPIASIDDLFHPTTRTLN